MLFSIIIPVYNTEDYVRETLESILKNDTSDCEILLIDDGSTDSSPEILEEYAGKYANISVIHKENGGLVSARKTGINNAVGEYILYVDADDTVSEDWIEKIKNAIDSAPRRPDLVAFGSEKVYENCRVKHAINIDAGYYDKDAMIQKIYPFIMSDRRLYFGGAIILPAPWNHAYKRELLLKHHCEDEGIRIGEDNAFSFECSLASEDMVVIKDVLYYYNKNNPNSILSKNAATRFVEREHLFKYISEHLKEYDIYIKDQIDDFYASRIIFDVVFLRKSVNSLSEGAKILRTEMKKTKITRFVKAYKLPARAMVFILLIKLHLYRIALIGAGFVKGDA